MTKRDTFLKSILPMVLPFGLIMVIMAAVFSIYECPIPKPAVLCGVAVVSALMFMLCRFTEKHKVIGGILITVILLAAYIVLQYLMWGGWRINHIFFQQWLLTAGSEVDDATYYLWSLFLGGSIFFSVTIYYFSRVMYRMSFLTLISLLPCVLYAKVMTDIENVYVILLAIVNVGIFVVHRNETKPSGTRKHMLPAVVSSGAFLFLLFLVCALIPKEEEAPYYNRFEDAFLGGDTSTELNADFTDLGSYSGNADRFSTLGNRRLYSVYAENGITYLKRQNFDYYDFEKDRWYPDEELSGSKISSEDWASAAEHLNLERLLAAIKKTEEYSPGFAEKFGVENLLAIRDISDPTYVMTISSLNFGAVYYLMPTRGINLVLQTADESEFYATQSGAFRRMNGPHPKDFEYVIDFYNDFAARNYWFGEGGSNLTNYTEDEMLITMWRVLQDNEDPLIDDVGEWFSQHSEAMKYRGKVAENNELISEQLIQLAEELTAGCVYDWEKAFALQNFFHSGAFVYDLDYIARDTSPEYFLFQSKRGTCSDFASAYVLLARAAGLTVRYAEGYVPEFSGRENTYYVKDSGSHAYPEVYLQGYGWTIFEPTTAADDIYEGREHKSFLDRFEDMRIDFGLAATLLYVGGFFLAVLMLVKWCLPFLGEMLFRVRIRFRTPNSSVSEIYKRLVKKALRHRIKGADCMTPRELQQVLTGRQIDISDLVEYVEASAYGGQILTPEQRKKAIAVYGKCSLYLHRKVKK